MRKFMYFVLVLCVLVLNSCSNRINDEDLMDATNIIEESTEQQKTMDNLNGDQENIMATAEQMITDNAESAEYVESEMNATELMGTTTEQSNTESDKLDVSEEQKIETTDLEAATHVHEYAKTVVVETCTSQGYTLHTCYCGNEYKSDYINVRAHDIEQEIIKPTCTTKGFTINKCKDCGHVYHTNETTELGHDYQEIITAPTCQSSGYTTFTCSHCQDSYQGNMVSKIGHTWQEWVVIQEPTLLLTGKKQKVCSVCETTETKEIEKINISNGQVVQLRQPDNPIDFMVYPDEQDFGKYYAYAVELYEAIKNHDESLYLYFDGDSYEHERKLYSTFKNTFEEKVLLNQFPVVMTNFATGAFSVGSGITRIEINPSATYILNKICYEYNTDAGLYDGIGAQEAVERINQYICNKLSYKLGYYDVFDVINSGFAQCAGYASLFYYLCDNAGLECQIVQGCALVAAHANKTCHGCHAWNKVKLGNEWYYIDTCWCDTLPSTTYYLTKELWNDRTVLNEYDIY